MKINEIQQLANEIVDKYPEINLIFKEENLNSLAKNHSTANFDTESWEHLFEIIALIMELKKINPSLFTKIFANEPLYTSGNVFCFPSVQDCLIPRIELRTECMLTTSFIYKKCCFYIKHRIQQVECGLPDFLLQEYLCGDISFLIFRRLLFFNIKRVEIEKNIKECEKILAKIENKNTSPRKKRR
jgi:hypothetical protein